MSTISASTTSTTAFKVTSDTTGTLVFQTGAVPTTAISIDASQAVGIGTSSPGYKLTVAGASGSAVLNLLESGVRSWGIRAGGTATNTFDIADFTAGATRLTIDSSGNLGIGTSSPAYKLDVNGDAQIGNATAATNRQLILNGVINKATRIKFQESGTDRWLIGNGAASETGVFEIYDATTGNNFVFTRTGNLGLGLTPSAWETSGALQLGTTASTNYSYSKRGLTNNAYFDGNWRYYASAAASLYQPVGAVHSWYTAASGTAGNVISFTEAMRLTSTGLGIAEGNAPTQVLSLYRGGSTNAIMSAGNSNTGLNGTWFGVDTAGNGIVNVRGAFPLIFSTSALERARIDANGRVVINGTTQLYTSTLTLYRTGNSYNLTSTVTGTGSEGHVVFENGNGAVGTIFTNGTATAYNTSSDYRLKNTIAPMTGALAKVALLKPCTYKWNADGSDGQGFIAHELAEVVPQCVTGEKDAVDAEGKPRYQGVDTSFLVATLTAAIQELTARVAQLESK